MSVNQDRVRLLVEALRSGEFSQGRGKLRSTDARYCCLGVACEVARRNGAAVDMQGNGVGTGYSYGDSNDFDNDNQTGYLPRVVADWYGFVSENPEVKFTWKDRTRRASATYVNDTLRFNFEQIAEAFESEYIRRETLEEYFQNAPSTETGEEK